MSLWTGFLQTCTWPPLAHGLFCPPYPDRWRFRFVGPRCPPFCLQKVWYLFNPELDRETLWHYLIYPGRFFLLTSVMIPVSFKVRCGVRGRGFMCQKPPAFNIPNEH